METLTQIKDRDRRLLADIADVLTEAERRSGDWLACRPGCTQCCLGPFAITQLDALRLRDGLTALDRADPERAARLRKRVAGYLAAMTPHYPGNPLTGELHDEENLPQSMDDVPCPALDPQTGLCDLYAARPIICRSFGPATRTGEGTLAACELCYNDATGEEMERCAVEIDSEGVEDTLLAALQVRGVRGKTIVAFAIS